MTTRTKKEIVAKLLEDKQITFDEALLLLEKEYVYPIQPTGPYVPPYTPPNIQPYVYTGGTTNSETLNQNFTSK